MRFWIKIAFLTFATYLACNTSLLLRDRRDRSRMVKEAEAVSRSSYVEVRTGDCSRQTMARLAAVQHRLADADARWERDATNLLLLRNQ